MTNISSSLLARGILVLLAKETLLNDKYTINETLQTTCECAFYTATESDLNKVLIAEYYPVVIADRNAEQTVIIPDSRLGYYENNLNAFQKNAELAASELGVTDIFCEKGTCYLVAPTGGNIADFCAFFASDSLKSALKRCANKNLRGYFSAQYKSYIVGRNVLKKFKVLLVSKLKSIAPFLVHTENSGRYPDIPDVFQKFLFDAAGGKLRAGGAETGGEAASHDAGQTVGQTVEQTDSFEDGLQEGIKFSLTEVVTPKPVIESLYDEPTKNEKTNFMRMYAAVPGLPEDSPQRLAKREKRERVVVFAVFLAIIILLTALVGIVAYFILLPVLN